MNILPLGPFNMFNAPDRAPLAEHVPANSLRGPEGRELAGILDGRINLLHTTIPETLVHEAAVPRIAPAVSAYAQPEMSAATATTAMDSVAQQVSPAAEADPLRDVVPAKEVTNNDFLDGFDPRVQWQGERADPVMTEEERAARQAAYEASLKQQAAPTPSLYATDEIQAVVGNEVGMGESLYSAPAYVREITAEDSPSVETAEEAERIRAEAEARRNVMAALGIAGKDDVELAA